MARLTEPVTGNGPPAESIETLKRKFLRQNREIAKVNSTQAMRIRALENEVSRLLTDNLNARGHIIRLERDLESSRSRHQNIDDLKSQMEIKIAELGALFKGFDGQPSPKKRKSLSPRENSKMIKSTPAKSPGPKDWKNVCALGEAMPGQEGRFPPTLPAIMENKYYPRKTLEQDELAALKEAADTTDSPELEPPPVSQFIDEDPVKIDLAVKSSKTEVEAPARSSSPTKFTSAMLEQRRKRRESVGITDIRRLSGDEAMIHEVTPDSLKVGAKRKISVRDDEERPTNSQVSPDDFKFTRKSIEEQAPTAATNPESALIKVSRETATAKESSRGKSQSTTTQSNTRRALAPKPTNDDVSNSPRKKTKPPVLDEISVAKKDHSKSAPLLERPRSRARPPRTENIPPKPIHSSTTSKIGVLPDPAPTQKPAAAPESAQDLEPETPAAQDLISPPFSEPSARPMIRDTPPPSDIGTESIQDNGRPGRRARASVSYAEPNLRDKMRRPTKELVDAVQKPTYIKIEDGESKISSGAKSSSKSVYIKAEPMDDDNWKSMANTAPNQDPLSPLSGKAPLISDRSSTNDIPSSRYEPITSSTSTSNLRDTDTASNRRSRIEKIEQPKLSRSTPSLPASTSSRHSRNQAMSGLDKDLSKLDIYDFQSTSPDTLEPNEQTRNFGASSSSRSEESKSSSGTAGFRGTITHLTRKNSSSKRNSALPLQMFEGSAGEESDVEGLGVRKRDMASRRRSVAACSSSSTASSNSREGTELRSGSERGVGKRGGGGSSGSGSGSREAADLEGGARQERANARRRSMML